MYRKAGIAGNREAVVYARVSTAKQKKDLETQAETVVSYCNNNGVKVHKAYKDITSGMNFNRKQFKEILGPVLDYKIRAIYITCKDRFSRISFDIFHEKAIEVRRMKGIM